MENKNEPAFARPAFSNGADFHSEQTGLTKREYFAGTAMQALLTNPGNIGWHHPETICKLSLQMADELLKQLETE